MPEIHDPMDGDSRQASSLLKVTLGRVEPMGWVGLDNPEDVPLPDMDQVQILTNPNITMAGNT